MPTLPPTMKVIEIARPGGPEVLQAATRPLPSLRPGEILVQVEAAGVNRPDLLQRAGNYPVPADASDLPGLEVAGTVAAVDAASAAWRIGDRVCALTNGGGYAQFCAVPATQALPIPHGLSMTEAASLPETFFTVYSNVFGRAHLAPGESLLVHGGTSGIGVAAIQIAAASGNRVFATAGGADKCTACLRLGAELAINYREQDFVPEIQRATGQAGVDVILDMVGGDYVGRNLQCLAVEGRLIMIAFLHGARAPVDLGLILRRRLTISGSTLRPRSAAFKGEIAQALRARVWPLIEAGRIRAVIERTFPLEQAADAHRLLEAGAHVGKIVLTV
jgi:putative PIG3 family NAD(P)H quinone oxidoreductase